MKIKILFEDHDIIVLYKPAGLPVQSGAAGRADVVSETKNYLAAAGQSIGEPYVGLVHRLDQPVEGILVLAKNERAAGGLSRQISSYSMKKIYHAVVYGLSDVKEGMLADYLQKDGRTNTSFIADKAAKDAKKAELYFKVLDSGGMKGNSLLEIKLITGRHHQIRVQLAHAGMPVLGDLKYGTGESRQISQELKIDHIALCAVQLDFLHPISKKELSFRIIPEGKAFVPNIGRE